MPVIYTIAGLPSTYERVFPITPVTAAHAATSSALLRYEEESGERHRRRVLLAQDLMTRGPQCIAESARVGAAREQMKRNGFQHLPVIAADQRLAGMLSDRDILAVGNDGAGDPVSKRMSVKVLTATEDTPIEEVAEAMLANRVHAIPIVDLEQRVVGIITTTDLLRGIVQHAPIELWA